MKESPIIVVMSSSTKIAGGLSPGGNATGVMKEDKKQEKMMFELKLESFEAASKIKSDQGG